MMITFPLAPPSERSNCAVTARWAQICDLPLRQHSVKSDKLTMQANLRAPFTEKLRHLARFNTTTQQRIKLLGPSSDADAALHDTKD